MKGKDKNLAKMFELNGFDLLANGSDLNELEAAIESFQKSYDNRNSYHNVAEILEFLKGTKNELNYNGDNSVNWCPIYERISTQYPWGLTNFTGKEMCDTCKKIGCNICKDSNYCKFIGHKLKN